MNGWRAMVTWEKVQRYVHVVVKDKTIPCTGALINCHSVFHVSIKLLFIGSCYGGYTVALPCHIVNWLHTCMYCYITLYTTVNREIFVCKKFCICSFCLQIFSGNSQPCENLRNRKFLLIMLFHNAQKFVWLCLRWTPIMLKLFHNFIYADEGLAFASSLLVMSVCVGSSLSPKTKQSVTDRYMYMPMWKLFLMQPIALYPVWLSNGMGVPNYASY